jgi:hypothetical protein
MRVRVRQMLPVEYFVHCVTNPHEYKRLKHDDAQCTPCQRYAVRRSNVIGPLPLPLLLCLIMLSSDTRHCPHMPSCHGHARRVSSSKSAISTAPLDTSQTYCSSTSLICMYARGIHVHSLPKAHTHTYTQVHASMHAHGRFVHSKIIHEMSQRALAMNGCIIS